MTLFKIFKGETETELNSVPVKDGQVYFTKDKGKLNVDMDGKRYQINANASDYLVDSEGNNVSASELSTVAYNTVLTVDNWTGSSSPYTYTYSNTAITCGKNGITPPIIFCNSNKIDYSLIDEAIATPGTGIEFTTQVKPTLDIDIVVIDIK